MTGLIPPSIWNKFVSLKNFVLLKMFQQRVCEIVEKREQAHAEARKKYKRDWQKKFDSNYAKVETHVQNYLAYIDKSFQALMEPTKMGADQGLSSLQKKVLFAIEKDINICVLFTVTHEPNFLQRNFMDQKWS